MKFLRRGRVEEFRFRRTVDLFSRDEKSDYEDFIFGSIRTEIDSSIAEV